MHPLTIIFRSTKIYESPRVCLRTRLKIYKVPDWLLYKILKLVYHRQREYPHLYASTKVGEDS
jgi:hypothetical protein